MVGHGALTCSRASRPHRARCPRDRSYAFVPMTHIFGLGTVLLASLHAGAQLVMRPQFDPADLLDALARHGVSQLQGPPALFSRLLAYLQEQGTPAGAGAALRLHRRGPLDLTLKNASRPPSARRCTMATACRNTPGRSTTRAWASSARHQRGLCGGRRRGAVTDPATGQALPAGERGELWMRGRGLMRGYFRDDQATAAVMRPGGWYASGDLGELHADGALSWGGSRK
jgi:long-subunit acyl-CoA synthetase (AMP-forming)